MNPLRLLTRYLHTTFQILFKPADFYRDMPLNGGVMVPLLYTVATNWLAAALAFLWKLPLGKLLQNATSEWTEVAEDLAQIDHPGRHAMEAAPLELLQRAKETLMPWFWGSTSVLLDPFFTLALLLPTVTLVWVGARLFLAPEKPAGFRQILRILCFASAPMLWNAAPIAGPIVAPIAVIATTAIGIREKYQARFARSLLVAVFPKLAFVGLTFFGVLAAGWLAFKGLAALFGL